jgi:hypothetical protein
MSSVSVNPPKTPVTKGSNGIATATIPNVCKMPGPPAPFVPAPLPNIGKSGMSPKDYSQDVTIEGNAVAIKGSTFESMGDIASKGTGGGLISANTHGITKFVGPGSMDVKIEGKNVQFLSDPMLNNCASGGSPPNAATMLGVIQLTGLIAQVEPTTCPLCGKTDHEGIKETEATKIDASSLAAAYNKNRKKYSGKNRANRESTMLGVVHCKTAKKYAAQSGTITSSLKDAAKDCGMEAPQNPPGIKERMEELSGNAQKLDDVWKAAEDYGEQTRNQENMPVAFTPGTCAAQQALVLALDDGGLPVSMTERWHSIDPETGKTNRKGKMKGLVLFIKETPKRGRQQRMKSFKHGESVPPCKTCEAILPLLLCFDKDKQCDHGKKKKKSN